MRGLFAVVGLCALVTSCGFDPKPKNGALPCDNGCPSGYVCRSDNRCWLVGAGAIGSGADATVDGKDATAAELRDADSLVPADSAAMEAGEGIPTDGKVEADVGVAIDIAPVDIEATLDTGQVDSAGDSSADAPLGTGGAGGNIDATGFGGASGTGGAVGIGGTSGGGGAGGSGGTGGSNADAAPDAPQGNPDACVSETDQQMCTRLGKNCNAISRFDNCGQSRSITTCGTCTGTLVCGAFVANVCPTICVFGQSTFDNCIFDL